MGRRFGGWAAALAAFAASLVAAEARAGTATITFSETFSTVTSSWNAQSNPRLTVTSTSGVVYYAEAFWLGTSGHSHVSAGVEVNHNQAGASLSAAQLQGYRIWRADGGTFTLKSMRLYNYAAVGHVTSTSAGTCADCVAYFNSTGSTSLPGNVTFGTTWTGNTEIFVADPYAAGPSYTYTSNYWDDIVLEDTTSDADGDGYDSTASGGTDCDDADATIHPGATETCNGKDDDCDGTADDGVGSTWYADDDGDGYGDASDSTVACSKPTGYVAITGDCDDTSATVHTGATEACNGKDDDCDGVVDDSAGTTWYVDADGDGHGTSSSTVACTKPSGYAAVTGDCDDTSASVSPDAAEVCNGTDDDCDGVTDELVKTTFYYDADADTYGNPSVSVNACTAPTGYVTNAADCDDADSLVSPDGTEICNLKDDDCDSLVDESGTTVFYADGDGDGYGDASSTKTGCTAPTGYVANDDDCDDGKAAVHPGATEVAYNGVDENCDGADLLDADGDGHDWDGRGGDDCVDTDASVYPGAPETADGVDEDCDGTVDEGTDAYDDDGDGYTEDAGDCDDADADVHPAAVEDDCDSVDTDCDGVVDDGTACYDDDGDGFTEDEGDCDDGDADIHPDAPEDTTNGIDDDCDGDVDDVTRDEDADGYSVAGGDCDDLDDRVYPGAEEISDGIDNDCDGEIDEGTDAYDDDGDGFSDDEGDCDDADGTVSPDAVEVANGVDDDCDGKVDEGTDAYDDDGDGYTEDGGDCDDDDATRNPGEQDVPDGVDNDCDDAVDEEDGGDTDTGLDDTGADTGGGKCGCATADPVGGAALAWGLVALLGVRRRR